MQPVGVSKYTLPVRPVWNLIAFKSTPVGSTDPVSPVILSIIYGSLSAQILPNLALCMYFGDCEDRWLLVRCTLTIIIDFVILERHMIVLSLCTLLGCQKVTETSYNAATLFFVDMVLLILIEDIASCVLRYWL